MHFNSKMVRLEDGTGYRRRFRSSLSFNSKMVRLEVNGAIRKYIYQFHRFQFQNGLIRRLPKSHKRIIQNPYGPCQLVFSRIDFPRLTADFGSRQPNCDLFLFYEKSEYPIMTIVFRVVLI